MERVNIYFIIRRWCVLTCRAFQTYEKEKNYINATEIIDITKIKTIKSDDKTSSNIFKIETLEGVYQFQAKTFHDKEAWIGSIGNIKFSKFILNR